MDNEALRLIARLKVAAARIGQPLDVVRFAADGNYARASMQRFAAATDEDGTMLVLQLMDKLAMTVPMPAARKAKEVVVAEDEQEKSENDARYVGRLR